MIKIVLVEDQDIVRQGLKTLLEIQSDLKIVGEAANGQQAIELVQFLHPTDRCPDIILMDIRMPIMDGVTATDRICQEFPGTKILVFTTFDDTKYIAEALRLGAKGYLLKDTPATELAEIIRSVHKGYAQFGPGILEKLMTRIPLTQERELPPGLTELTPREREILRAIAKGANNRDIAQSLFLSEGTVRNHISHILTRLDLRDRTQAAIVANSFMSYLEQLK